MKTEAPVKSISATAPTVPVYGKWEVKFEVETTSKYPLFQYDPAPPPGVEPGTGVTVEGIFKNTTTGEVSRHPAFYMTNVARTQHIKGVRFIEAVHSYWVLRFAPQTEGAYTVAIHVLDKDQDYTSEAVAHFSATPPTGRGFIRVSKDDPRYFEFSNGDLYYPVGPALVSRFANTGYAPLSGTGQTWDRIWLGGLGIYSTNWARWQLSSSRAGNEGWSAVFDMNVHAPGSELSHPMRLMDPAPKYPQPLKTNISDNDEKFKPRFYRGKKYRMFLRYKLSGITEPKTEGLPFGFLIQQKATAKKKWTTILPHTTTDADWNEITKDYVAVDDGFGLLAQLDNVTGGRVNIDELSIKEILPNGALGGELIRNPRADEHTYIEQRPAAYLDWMLEQAEQSGVYLQLVVHDKNDWVTKRLKPDGSFGAPEDGAYYQPEDTKARWLLRNWYRYLAARWGYSTAVFAWELNNEGPPESPAHWKTTEAFAKYMHEIDAHPHLASTSFWCCWEPKFWGNHELYPNVDYADIHEYTSNPMAGHENTSQDIAAWNFNLAAMVGADNVGKPIIRAETGITDRGNQSLLNQPNPGVWYHNLLWVQLGENPMYDPGYFTTAHFIIPRGITKGSPVIPKNDISRIFYQFVEMVDYNKGGYEPLNAVVSNPTIRVLGQKNLKTNKVFAWIQNATHTWKNVLDNVRSVQSADLTIAMNPHTTYRIEWFDTCSEEESTSNLSLLKTENLVSDAAGNLTFQVIELADDVAICVKGMGQ